jgi:hypothetical protein
MKKRVLETRLEAALAWIKEIFPEGRHLKLVVTAEPKKGDDALLGEWRDREIIIYAPKNHDEAVVTLFHEYLHFLLDNVDKPWELICNSLLQIINKLTYELSDKSIDTLAYGIKHVYDLQTKTKRARRKTLNLHSIAKLTATIWYIQEGAKREEMD